MTSTWKPEGYPTVSPYLIVDDVDAVYERALAAGAESVKEPRHEEGDPDRRAGVRDPAGNVWWLATQVG